MCEVLVARWAQPQPFTRLVPYAMELERMGIAGFGWGVAWLDDGGLRVHRQLGRFVDEAPAAEALRSVGSTQFLVHLRRPSMLSTVQLADTQPFTDGRRAFSHNGYLDRAEELRPRYADRLAGRADSEVGWVYFRDRLADGMTPEKAMAEVDSTFGGHVNLAYLDVTGHLAVYAGHRSNAFWTFRLEEAVMAATALHSADTSLFDLVFRGATDRAPVAVGTTTEIDAPA